MKTRTTAATILGALLLAAAHGQQPSPLPPPRAGFTFPRQTLSYSVDWRVFPAGTAVVRFEANGDQERITASADTIGAINLLFHVSDHFQSSFDRATGCTSEFDKQTVEGRRRSVQRSSWITPGQVDSGRKEPGNGANEACRNAGSGVSDRSAVGGFLCLVAAHGSWEELCYTRWWTHCTTSLWP